MKTTKTVYVSKLVVVKDTLVPFAYQSKPTLYKTGKVLEVKRSPKGFYNLSGRDFIIIEGHGLSTGISKTNLATRWFEEVTTSETKTKRIFS